MKQLKLKSGGILELITWNSDTRSNDISDVTDIAYAYLNNYITLDDDVVLKDLFLLINQNLDIFTIIFRNYIDIYTFNALNNTPDINDSMDWVELYWHLDAFKNELTIPSIPEYHGVQIAKEDGDYYKKGDKIKYAIELSPIENSVNCPLKLNNKIEFNGSIYDIDSYTLYQVILGVIWEISFHGDPVETNTFLNNLTNQVKEIKDGTEITYNMEEVLENLKENYELE